MKDAERRAIFFDTTDKVFVAGGTDAFGRSSVTNSNGTAAWRPKSQT